MRQREEIDPPSRRTSGQYSREMQYDAASYRRCDGRGPVDAQDTVTDAIRARRIRAPAHFQNAPSAGRAGRRRNFAGRCPAVLPVNRRSALRLRHRARRPARRGSSRQREGARLLPSTRRWIAVLAGRAGRPSTMSLTRILRFAGCRGRHAMSASRALRPNARKPAQVSSWTLAELPDATAMPLALRSAWQ